MYYKYQEMFAVHKKDCNICLKKAAAARLSANRANAHKSDPKDECAPNRKASARLQRRLKDYEAFRLAGHDMKVQMRINGGGFHKPGSLQ